MWLVLTWWSCKREPEAMRSRVQGLEEKMNFEHRTLNVERRMAKPLARGLGLIGSSKLEVERWTLIRKR